MLAEATLVETKKVPFMFSGTRYRLPTKEELEEIHDCKLSAKEIIKGFSYTIIGRGIKSEKTKRDITKSLRMLSELYPDNEEYKKAIKDYTNEAQII